MDLPEPELLFAGFQRDAKTHLGAPGEFELFVLDLVRLEEPRANLVRGKGGRDWGIDVLVGNFAEGSLSVWQCKFWLVWNDSSRRAGVKDSFASAVLHAKENGCKISRWTLAVPCVLAPEEQAWFDQWSSQVREEYELDYEPDVVLWNGVELRSRLLPDNAIPVRREYFQSTVAPTSSLDPQTVANVSAFEARRATGRFGGDDAPPAFPSDLEAVLDGAVSGVRLAELQDELTAVSGPAVATAAQAVRSLLDLPDGFPLLLALTAIDPLPETILAQIEDGVRRSTVIDLDRIQGRDVQGARTIQAAAMSLQDDVELLGRWVGLVADHPDAALVPLGARWEAHRASQALSDLGAVTTQLGQAARMEASGVLVVQGGWGTGKSFEFGRFALRHLRTGSFVAFCCGDRLRDPYEDWILQLSRTVMPTTDGDDLLELGEKASRAASGIGVVAIDAVNEAAPDQALALRGLISGLESRPHMFGLISRRVDHPVSLDRNFEAGVYVHVGVDPQQSWDVLRRYFELPPVVIPWAVPDYRRPLILKVFARVVSRQGTDQSPQPLTVAELFDEWISLLGEEFARLRQPNPRKARHDRGELAEVLRAVLDAGSVTSRAHVRAFIGPPVSDAVDAAIDFLVDEGVLAETEGELTYALQRVKEFFLARAALERRRRFTWSSGSAEVPTRPQRPDSMMRALVGLSPVVKGRELFVAGPHALRPKGSTLAFLESMLYRHPSQVRPDTLKLARTLLTTPLAPGVWTCVLLNSVIAGHGLGAAFVHSTLGQMTKGQVDRQWTKPLWAMFEIGSDEATRDELATALVWIDDETRHRRLSLEHASDISRMLTWLLNLPLDAPSIAAARGLSTLMTNYPHTVVQAMNVAHSRGDLDMISGVWSAALAAYSRVGHHPNHPTKRVIERATEDLRGRLPPHYQLGFTVFALTRLISGKRRQDATAQDYRAFLEGFGAKRQALPLYTLLTAAPWAERATRGWTNHFLRDETGSPPEPGLWGAAIVNRLGGVRAMKVGSDSGLMDEVSSDDIIGRKYAAQAQQLWLGELSKTVDTVSTVTWTPEAGLQVNLKGQQPFNPYDGVLDAPGDASVPLRLSVASDRTELTSMQPPLVDLLAGRVDAEGPELGRVVLPGDREWFLLSANYRIIEPGEGTQIQSPGRLLKGFTSTVVDHSWRKPKVGPRLHLYARVRSLLVPMGTDAAEAPEMYDEIRRMGHWRDTSAPSLGGWLREGPDSSARPVLPAAATVRFRSEGQSFDPFHSCHAPSQILLDQLGAHWTGEDLDFHRADGAPMLTSGSPLDLQEHVYISRSAVDQLRMKDIAIVTFVRVDDFRGGLLEPTEGREVTVWSP